MSESPRSMMAVASYSPGSGGGVQVRFLDHGDEVRLATMSGLDSPLLVGTHQVSLAECGGYRPLPVTITSRGQVFDLKAGAGASPALGTGIVDPEFPDTLLVSWSCGKIQPTGIVKYVVGSEPGTIIPTYTSVSLKASGVHDVRGGLATARTDGRYTITYKGAGNVTVGPFDLTITPRAGVFDLAWDMAGDRVFDGFGFPDPRSNSSIVAVFWSTRSG